MTKLKRYQLKKKEKINQENLDEPSKLGQRLKFELIKS